MTARFLLDASAYWRLMQNPELAGRWADAIDAWELGLSSATRTEILYSARNAADRDRMSEDLDAIAEPVAVPKDAFGWIDTAQYKLTLAGAHRSAGVVDLILCATAATRRLAILHDDRDFDTVARILPEVTALRITAPRS
ncbi:PIN domain-containing protein [Actinospica robiniae]|uniref:PIN domain-containing protein n=1 Tax=Actinospica robiniae TaxID=304901 RepID=UPI00041700FF|nr:PIN domain-containing protein [Actinospica robiniae]